MPTRAWGEPLRRILPKINSLLSKEAASSSEDKHKASERSSGAPRNDEAHNSSVIENGVAPEATPASNESQLHY